MSALAKFRCGVAPIKLETGRYEKIAVDIRICPLCKITVECEKHILLFCNAYEHIMLPLLEKTRNLWPECIDLSDEDKLTMILLKSQPKPVTILFNTAQVRIFRPLSVLVFFCFFFKLI
jgi:hypothetical protein